MGIPEGKVIIRTQHLGIMRPGAVWVIIKIAGHFSPSRADVFSFCAFTLPTRQGRLEGKWELPEWLPFVTSRKNTLSVFF